MKIDFSKPQKIDPVTAAFPATIKHLMPEMKDIPDGFKKWHSQDKWVQWQTDWFYFGVKDLKPVPKEGIVLKDALVHLATIQNSYEPSHEHKQAAVAYLMSLWFDDVSYTRCERTKDGP